MVVDVSRRAGSWSRLPGVRVLARRAARLAQARSGVAVLPAAELSVVLSDDEGVRILNRDWRGKDRPTNVLSFPAVPAARIGVAPLLGDVVLAFETLEREAVTQGIPLADHFAHLVVHGTLHVLGFDHEDAGEGDRMEALETAVLRDLGIADPYAANGPDVRGDAADHG